MLRMNHEHQEVSSNKLLAQLQRLGGEVLLSKLTITADCLSLVRGLAIASHVTLLACSDEGWILLQTSCAFLAARGYGVMYPVFC